MTATYVPAHSRHTTSRMKYDAYARYRTTDRPIVDAAKTYPGRFAAAVFDDEQRAMTPSTPAKNSRPKNATGTPPIAPKRLVYAAVQFSVELTSQKLSYVGLFRI